MNKTFEFSSEQKAVFNWFAIGKENLCVEARAGAAKTTSIMEGLNRANVPSALYAVFNKKNQIEAQGKITNPKVVVKTLHSVGFGIVLQHWRGVQANSFTEYERVQTLYPEAPKQVIFMTAKLVSFLKNSFLSPTLDNAKDTCLQRDIDASKKDSDSGWTQAKLCEMALKSIELSLEYPQNRKISFDDMVFLPGALGWIKPAYHLVTIDEAQDMSLPQLTMATGLALPNGRVCLVGDSHQAIYGFRGAMQDSMSIFADKLQAKKLTLTTTYRCPKSVVALVKNIVPDIQAWDKSPEGEILNDSITNLPTLAKVKDVILSRTNAPLMRVCLSLLRVKTPCYIEGRDIGKTLIALVESFEAKDMADFLNKLESWLMARQAKATGWNAATLIAHATDQAETLRTLAETCLDVPSVIQKINSLFQDADGVRIPSVVCSTVHKAKGLEFDNIFILSDTFSAGKRVLTPAEIKEEQNIKYVAHTRCKFRLTTIAGT